MQHLRLVEAAHRHALPANPLANVRPEELVQAALREVRKLAAATDNELAQVLPPVDELLP